MQEGIGPKGMSLGSTQGVDHVPDDLVLFESFNFNNDTKWKRAQHMAYDVSKKTLGAADTLTTYPSKQVFLHVLPRTQLPEMAMAEWRVMLYTGAS